MADRKNPEIPPYPLLFKHMALAIYKSKSLGGQGKQAFESSMNVALSRLIEYRLATATSSLGNVTLTSAGRTRENAHKAESDSANKTGVFDKLFTKLYSEGKQASKDESLTPQDLKDKLERRGDMTPPGAVSSEDSPRNMTTDAAAAQKQVPKRGFPATQKAAIKARKHAALPKKNRAPKSLKGKAKKPPTGSIRSKKTPPLKNRKPMKPKRSLR